MSLDHRLPASSWSRRAFLGATAAAAAAPIFVPRLAAQTQPAGAPFPPNFLWGTATSAYQVEGAANEAGKGESVWDAFVQQPGVIADGQTGDTTCDFFHRYPTDIALMRALHLRAFRFSLAWTRIQPAGIGPARQPGLDFYSRLVDALLAAGIQPVVTLFHWDTPLALQSTGGWQNRAIVGQFADYASLAIRALGDRVRYWLTINEPRSFIGGGYLTGLQAPGLKLTRGQALAAAHNVLLAHGSAVQALRASASRPIQVGIPIDVSPALPVTAADAPTAQATTFASPLTHFDPAAWWHENAWWLDPVYRGAYPAAAFAALGGDAPSLASGDMALIRQPLDFIAANVYGGRRVSTGPNGVATPQPWPPGFPITATGWQVTPEALYWAPLWLHQRYGLPVFVTENGCATRDWISLDGAVHDPQRLDFADRYLRFLAQSAAAGTPLLGYLHWSLLDNFDWQNGFTQRYGLLYVDFSSGGRVLKQSARWFAQVAGSNGAALATPA
jgi:beta-glucosidase